MSAAILSYSTAKGYVQSTYLIVTSPDRYQLPDDTIFMLSYHMLLGFAVELYLKAYLGHAGRSEAELRNHQVRHNLQKLLDLSKASGFSLLAANNLVNYLGEKHGSLEYRYMKPDSSYHVRSQAEVFAELNELDTYVDREIGASASKGKTPASTGWIVPADRNGWRI